MAEHLHYVGDGRGWRQVFVDGRRIDRCVLADVRRGVALQHVGRRQGAKLVCRAEVGAVRVERVRG